MDTQEILSKIAKLKKAVESESDADVKASYNKKIAALEAQVADAEAKVEKKEEKAAAQEKKTLGEADEQIKKLEKALASESDPDVKARYQKKLNELKGTLKDVKEEIKEEKKEIAEQKKEIKQAVKEVKSVQKEVRKTAIKKVAKKKVERKKVETKKTKRKEKLNRVLSDLDAMIEKNRKLKSKYGSGYKGTGKPSDLERDAGRKAKPFGYRFVGKHDYRVPTEMQIKRGLKRGTIDYEGRPNRADVNPDKKVKLAHGGNVKDSAIVALVTAQEYDKKSKEFVGKERVEKIKKGNEIFSDAFNRHTPFAESTQERMVKDRYEAFWNVGNPDRVVKVKKVEITKEGRMPHHYGDGGMMEDGGMMKKGGTVKKKKVGYSEEDKARYAKPAGWRWKDEAVTKRVIERKQLSMQPSKKMRDKYPDLVYYEDRLNKADKKPTRTSADSI
jgi:myosin heavy subunit